MQQTMQAQQLRRMAERSAVAFLLAVLCVYPLYIDKFSNLGVVKFTGVATLSWAFCLWLGALAAIGARPRAGRLPWRTDHGLWALGAASCSRSSSVLRATSSSSSLISLCLRPKRSRRSTSSARRASRCSGVRAVTAFQNRFSLAADGVTGRSTWNKLKEVALAVANKIVDYDVAPGQFTATVRQGSSGTAVRAVQFYLRRLAAWSMASGSSALRVPFSASMAVL